MLNTRTTRADQMRADLIADLMERVEVINERGDDRVGYIWSLKMIAEIIAKLDEADRLEGLLPLTLRPPLMLTTDEAAHVLHIVEEYTKLPFPEISGAALFEKLHAYFDGRIEESIPRRKR